LSQPEDPRNPESAADRAIAEALRDAAMTAAALRKKLNRPLAAWPAKERPKLITERLRVLVESGRLYKYPRGGKVRGIKYSARPAAASDYLGTLRKQLDALATKLASAGVRRDALLDALRVEAPAQAPADELPHRILQYLKGKPGGIGVTQLREECGVPVERKAAFDSAVLSLYRDRRVYLDRHDFPQGLTEAERQELITDGAGNYFVVIALRDADVESVS
jgi:hypothetical protein